MFAQGYKYFLIIFLHNSGDAMRTTITMVSTPLPIDPPPTKTHPPPTNKTEDTTHASGFDIDNNNNIIMAIWYDDAADNDINNVIQVRILIHVFFIIYVVCMLVILMGLFLRQFK